jgi:hypothetical protein
MGVNETTLSNRYVERISETILNTKYSSREFQIESSAKQNYLFPHHPSRKWRRFFIKLVFILCGQYLKNKSN